MYQNLYDYLYDDVHYTPKGNGPIGETMAAEIAKQRWLEEQPVLGGL